MKVKLVKELKDRMYVNSFLINLGSKRSLCGDILCYISFSGSLCSAILFWLWRGK